ncbi:MAG: hypothetical protein QOJ22_1309 [Thermoleophilaceae bacterium]|nr:hypothetical protein [Thermoleophilaceae bacterium]
MESLEEQAVIDDLTGLRNQRALWRELSRRAAVCSEASPLAVVMVDFDLFKEINEGYGHAVGDAVLRRAASVLRAAAPSPRLAFRYGGEEFVMLVPGSETDGRELAEHVRAEVARQNGALPAITISCGVAELSSPVEPWVALDRADSALRDAKRTGRNRVVMASRSDTGASAYLVEEMEHETARRAALALALATLEVRDHDTAEHSDDVLTLCESIGRELGFAGRELERLMAGAQLHDVGKVAVPSAILNKPGPLDAAEWAVIREHTVIGERILRSVPEMAEVATIVRHSHEHWNGGGYPDGLTGEQIPLASRVILCADTFHAIRSDRPYRAGRTAPEALAEVRRAAGTQLDPAVVTALVRVARDVRNPRSSLSLPRRKRLIALLATLAIGSGTAVAAIPDVRDAVRSIFALATAESRDTASSDTGKGFDLGPLGALLSLDPATSRRGGADTDEKTSIFDAPRKPGSEISAAGDLGASPRDGGPSTGKSPGDGRRDKPGGDRKQSSPEKDGPAGAKPDTNPDRSGPSKPDSNPQPGPVQGVPQPPGQGPAAAPTPPPVSAPTPTKDDGPKGDDDDDGDDGRGDDDDDDDDGGGRGRDRDDDHEGGGHDKHHGDGNKHQGHTRDD